MADHRILWQSIQLPQWDSARLYRLFVKHAQGTPTPQEKDEYARLLMVLIAANLGRRKWIHTLRKHGLDPEDVAVDVLMFVVAKTPSIRLKVPCERVLLKFLNMAIFRRLVTEIRQSYRVMEQLPASILADDTLFSTIGILDIGALVRHLRALEDKVCQGSFTDQIGICVLYRYLCRQLVRQNTILSHSQLPARLRRRIPVDHHGLIAYRLNKAVRQYAQSL